MEGGTARQVGALAEDDVLPAKPREPVEDGGAADASADDDRPRTPFHANTLIRDPSALCRCSGDSMRTSLGFALTALLAAGWLGPPRQPADRACARTPGSRASPPNGLPLRCHRRAQPH